jgi:epoxyqueuosine reductase
MVNFDALQAEGCNLAVVSLSRLAELKTDLDAGFRQGQYGTEFTQTYQPRFKFAPPEELKSAKSVIIVAMPSPPTKAVFNWKGEKKTFILPPTYTAYDEKRLHVETLVAEAVGRERFKIASPSLPLKLLAVRSGLAAYGRNNIAYVEGMGSFMRLTAVYTDMPLVGECWQHAKQLSACRDCRLCMNACPTGAINEDRFLLHAEKCLTYHNEKTGDVPFPSWIRPEWHNCVIGCIRCQAACPENKPFFAHVGETAEFTEQETMLMLKGTSCEELPKETVRKMKILSLTDYYNELPRNLTALLSKEAL